MVCRLIYELLPGLERIPGGQYRTLLCRHPTLCQLYSPSTLFTSNSLIRKHQDIHCYQLVPRLHLRFSLKCRRSFVSRAEHWIGGRGVDAVGAMFRSGHHSAPDLGSLGNHNRNFTTSSQPPNILALDSCLSNSFHSSIWSPGPDFSLIICRWQPVTGLLTFADVFSRQ